MDVPRHGMRSAVEGWTRLALVHRIDEGNRNEVWRGSLDGRPVAVRRSRRGAESLLWELDVLAVLDERGFRVPVPIATNDGARSHLGVVVHPWVDGREPSSRGDWDLVADELRRLHDACADIGQRPECMAVTAMTRASCSVDADLAAMPDDAAALVLAVFATVADAPVSLIHGDPGPSNIRIDETGKVWLLDWDESRVDVTWHDLSSLDVDLVVRGLLTAEQRSRAIALSHAWEAANGWTAEPDYARRRLAALAGSR